MDNINQSAASFPVDPEHAGLRVGIVSVFIILWVVMFAILNMVIANTGFPVLAIIVSFALTALLTQQVEKWLKIRWPSGRAIEIDPQHIRIMKKDDVQQEINADQQVNVLLWRFVISRRARVPKGWLMVACALEQDDRYIPVYTFMSQADFDSMKAAQHFALLQSKKELERDGRQDMRLAGAQRRLHLAENVRWMEGAEMNAQDFKNLIVRLQEQFPQWMPAVI